MTIKNNINKKFVKKSILNLNYKKLCAFDRKCFTHKDKTNEIFCRMIKNYKNNNFNNILCLDSSLTKTSNMLIQENLTTKKNIILIEANKKNHQKHISNGFNSILGSCNNVLGEYYFNKFDGIYLDAIGTVETVGELVFDTLKNNLTNDKCVIGYTFVKRGRIKGSKFETSYNEFMKKFNLLLNKYGYKLIDSKSYSYGSPKTGQANMFSEFVFVEKNNL
jgi:hypothetical protein